jgi:Tol biopolymer transport system component
MAISPGKRLGPYEILNAIGAGGMGEVYRATDTRLDRIVAIKVLPAHLADKPELRDRFEREARTIASLNHPHICTLHDIGRQDGTDFLVMEYLEGDTLAQRLMKGPLPLEQVLQFAIEIADALDKAHRNGVTHRDLKPGNIMLTKSGTKLLDFGLAKLRQEASPATPFSEPPTLKDALTAQGAILGTLQYMAPEQIEGSEVDARTDIFAFGAVVYEMATGQKAFGGKSSASVMAKILETDPPPMSSLQPMTPPQLDSVVKTCLAKEPNERWQAASDLCRNLQWIAEGASQARIPAPVGDRRKGRERLLAAIAAIAVVAALAFGLLYFRGATQEVRVLKLSVLPPEKAAFNPTSLPAVSPDGRSVAFAVTGNGQTGLWVRDLDSLASRPLPGTDGAYDPFWSPDSRFIAFFAGGTLKKLDVAGGPALSLCDASVNARGGSWSKNDVIVFAPNINSSLFRVPAAGGSATPLTALDQGSGEVSHRFPWFLPDGRHLLYTALNREVAKTAVYVGDVDSKTRYQLVATSSNAVYAPPGYLLFLRERTLMAQPFDAGKARTTGDPIPIAEQVDSVAGNISQAQFSSSQSGVLAYTSGGAGGNVQLAWFDRSGKLLGTVGTPGVMYWATISPDGNTVATDRLDPQTGFYDIWLHDLMRGTASRFTFNSPNDFPAWSPDGGHIAFTSNRDGGPSILYQKAATGAAQDEALDKAPHSKRPDDWSRDGRYIIEETPNDPKTGQDIWVLPLFGDRKPFPYLQSVFNERNAKLSSNGQWLAYVSDETKRNEVYVQTFPTPGGKWQVSTNGGSFPVWSRDGKELFFIGADQKMMAVEVKGGAKFEAGVPKPLFDARYGAGPNGWFDVSKDGRFLIPTPAEQAANVPMTVVVNWTAELKK